MEAVVEARKGEMSILGPDGDTKLIWDPNNADEVEAARATFDSLRAKGYLAYAVERGGGKGEVLTEFDPNQEKIILAPAVRGG